MDPINMYGNCSIGKFILFSFLIAISHRWVQLEQYDTFRAIFKQISHKENYLEMNLSQKFEALLKLTNSTNCFKH